MLIMMMAIITVWKDGPQGVNAVPAIRARPMATPACGEGMSVGGGGGRRRGG